MHNITAALRTLVNATIALREAEDAYITAAYGADPADPTVLQQLLDTREAAFGAVLQATAEGYNVLTIHDAHADWYQKGIHYARC